MGKISTPDGYSSLTSAPSGGVMSWFRSARDSISLACLLAVGAQPGCFAPKNEGNPNPDTPAAWVLREPAQVIPQDQICFPSTVPIEVTDWGGEPPSRWAMRRGTDQGKLERILYDRLRTTGDYEVVKKEDGGTMISFVPTSGAYRDVLAMYPMVQTEAAALHTPESELELTGPAIADWTAAEAERISLNREIEQWRLLKQCLGFEIADPALSRAALDQEPFSPSWTNRFLVDPTDPGLFTGSELMDGESMLMPPYVPPEGQKLKYVSFDRVRGDHLSVFLEQVIDPKYFDQIPRLAVFIRLTSPSGKWNVPSEYLNQSEQFGAYLRSLEFTATGGDPYALKKKYWGKSGSLRSMLVREQYKYHVNNHYPAFTEANRDDLIAQLAGPNGPLVKVEPTANDFFVLRYIYEGDPENADQMAYTYPETLTLLREMGQVVDTTLHQAGLPEHIKAECIDGAVGRTAEYQEALSAGVTLADYLDPGPDNPFRGQNRNAVHGKKDADGNFEELTSHAYLNAVDVSTVRVRLTDTRTGISYVLAIQENEGLIGVARVAMYEFLAKKGQEGKALGAPEGDHVHMVGVRQQPEQPVKPVVVPPAPPKKGSAKKGGKR